MATSAVEICNDALILCGSERITSLGGTSKGARLCNEQYAKARDQLLISHPWNFAMKRVSLSELTDLPSGWEGNGEFDYAFQLPADCLRVWKLDEVDADWAIENGYLFTNYTPVSISYITKEEDPTKFSKTFEKVLAFDIALKIGYALTQSAAFINTIKEMREEAIREARSFDAQEKSSQQIDADDFIKVRF